MPLNKAGHPFHAKITAVSGFRSEAIADSAKRHLAPVNHVLSNGLGCFRAVTTANCQHKVVITDGKKPNALPMSAGSTSYRATSRPTSAAPSMSSTLANTVRATSAAAAFASSGASRWLIPLRISPIELSNCLVSLGCMIHIFGIHISVHSTTAGAFIGVSSTVDTRLLDLPCGLRYVVYLESPLSRALLVNLSTSMQRSTFGA